MIMKNFKRYVLPVLCVCSFAIGYKVADMNQEVVTKVKIQKHIVIQERIVKTPGGKEIITRTIRDDSRMDSIQISKNVKQNWIVGVSAGPDRLDFSDPTWTLSIDRRVLSDLYIGVYGRSDGEVGVSIKYTF